jgi:glycosyltransferase involved in cell wall biosynthesis
VAIGAAAVVFPLLRGNRAPVQDILAVTMRSFVLLALPTVAVLATAPDALMTLILTRRYADSLWLLPVLAAAGLGYAALTFSATVLLGLRAYRASRRGLLAALTLPAGTLAGWRIHGLSGLAFGTATGALIAGTLMCAGLAPLLPARALRQAAWGFVVASLLLGALYLLRPYPVAWLALAGVTGIVVLRHMLHRPRNDALPSAAGAAADQSPGPLRVLHLGFEDPRMPGAGGGATRTHEINRRLARWDRITVLVQRFPGWADRDEDGVRYVHIGIGSGRNRLTRLIGYIACLPLAARRHPADLVVEDFFAPISTLGAPTWTGRPTIGVVQWLNAEEKARQYKLPLHIVERLGVLQHVHLIAVSCGVAEQLRAINPRLTVDVISNGVMPEAFQVTPRLGTDVLYVGRLENQQKGTDLLLRAWAVAEPSLIGARLVIAGLGPDEKRLRRLASDLGIESRVEFRGWVSGSEKYELLAAARLVALPSRFETFGLVALEAQAAGTPVIAFDIPCLRELVPAGCGWLVPPFDVQAFAARLVSLYDDDEQLSAAARRGRSFAAEFSWDLLAAMQAKTYEDAVLPSAETPRQLPGGAWPLSGDHHEDALRPA